MIQRKGWNGYADEAEDACVALLVSTSEPCLFGKLLPEILARGRDGNSQLRILKAALPELGICKMRQLVMHICDVPTAMAIMECETRPTTSENAGRLSLPTNLVIS